MRAKYKIAGIILIAIAILMAGWLFLQRYDIAVLAPEGTIAQQQRNLILFASLLSLVVVVPVFFLAFWITWRYRESNTSQKRRSYRPEWDGHRGLELLWWAIPCVLILVLAVITWQSSHKLDPYKPLASTAKPLTIQVIALPWKWLFIYPQQHIASVNYVQFPEDTPLNFHITADAPMNSFWIPKLGGQVYAMAGMDTQLHLMAHQPGTYQGSSANLSGEGFAGMKFTAKSSTRNDFDRWVSTVRRTENTLDTATYDELAKPSQDNPPASYTSKDTALYDTVIMKYMMPMEGESASHKQAGTATQ